MPLCQVQEVEVLMNFAGTSIPALGNGAEGGGFEQLSKVAFMYFSCGLELYTHTVFRHNFLLLLCACRSRNRPNTFSLMARQFR